MTFPKIKQVRAFVVRGGGADYHDQGGGHWIDDHIATPMCALSGIPPEPPKLRHQRAGHPGGGDRGRERRHRLCRHHRRRARLPLSWKSIWRASWKAAIRPRSRRSGTRCISPPSITAARAWWSMPSPAWTWRCGTCWASCAASRSTSFWAVRCATSSSFYATGARPDLAKEMGFIGGKMPLHHGPAEGEEGLNKDLAEIADDARARRHGFLADAGLLDEPGSQLCDPAGARGRGNNPG